MDETATNPQITDGDRQRLLDAASRAATRAYAPCSGVNVGAVVLTGSSALHLGCNVENASYGLTICAERAAIFNAVSNEDGDEIDIRAIAITTSDGSPITPCGTCRQVIAEFGPDVTVLDRTPDGMNEIPIARILPDAFHLD